MTPSPNPFPAAFSSLSRVRRDSSWGESMSLLAQAGFTVAAQASALPDPPWPDGADPMGPRPSPPGGPEALRELALMSHLAGFVLVLSSQERDPSEKPGSSLLNELHLYFQIDVGAGRGDPRRERLFSGGYSIRPDGSSLFLGRCDGANSHCGSLGEALEALHADAAPLPLAQWSPEFFHTPPGPFHPHPLRGRRAEPPPPPGAAL